MRPTTHELKWILKYSILLLIITSIPYLLGYLNSSNVWRFSGYVFGVEDGNTYIAKMIRGSMGDWLFRTPYTSFPQPGVIANLSYILIGKLAKGKALHDQIVALFQLYRWFAVIFCNISIYIFIAQYFEDKNLRKRALVLISAGGGLGWMALVGVKFMGYGGMPLEFYSPEAFGFLMELGLPHLLMARGFLFLGLTSFLLFLQKTELRWSLSGGVFLLSAILFQPQIPLIGWVIIFCTSLVVLFTKKRYSNEKAIWKKEFIVRGIWFFLIPLPFFLYTALTFITDPYLMQFTGQNIIDSPPIYDWLISFGWAITFAALGFYKQRKTLSGKQVLLITWLIVLPILIYSPYNLQRRLSEGTWVIIVIAAIIGISSSKRIIALIGWTGLYSGFLTTLVLLAGAIGSVEKRATPVFRLDEEVRLFNSLVEFAEPDAVFLAPLEISNALPAWAPMRVVIGHGPESVNYQQLKVNTIRFFDNHEISKEDLAFLERTFVNYIIIPTGQGKQLQLDLENDLFTRVHLDDNFAVYRYNLNQ